MYINIIIISTEKVSDGHKTGNKIINSVKFLKPSQIHQFLYQVKPNSDLSKKVSGVGHMKFTWRSQYGGVGKLQTPLLERTLPPLRDFDLAVVDLPSSVELEVPVIFS